MQLQTRLWGGVDGGGACRVCARERVTGGLQRARVGGRRGGVGSYDLKEPFSSEVSASVHPSKHNHKSRWFC